MSSARQPNDIGIILSYRCHSGCKHCLYNSGPAWGMEAISSEMLRQALQTTLGWDRPPQIHLTGGEPFIYFDLLLEGTRIAADLGITVYAETSAMWCTDEEMARGRFAALRDAGMTAVLISCSPFHAEKIPPVRTVRAVRAALDVFGQHGVIVYLPGFLQLIQQFDLERPTPISHYQELLGVDQASQLLWGGYGLISGGRAGYKLGHLVDPEPAETFAGENCTGDILYAPHSHMDLYGNYIPAFCGGLTAADWRYNDPLLRPYPDAALAFHPVSKRVNSARIDDPECMAPVPEAARQDSLF